MSSTMLGVVEIVLTIFACSFCLAGVLGVAAAICGGQADKRMGVK
jgi:hypothetical protein